MYPSFFLQLSALACILAISSAACPSPPDCYVCSSTQAVCKLCPEDQDIPDTITDLKLIPGGCRLLQSVGLLRTSSFSRYPNLERLTLNNVHVMRFFGAVFQANTKLRILSMAQNEIRSFDSRVFEGLSNLEELNMAQSKIKLLIEASFKELTGLKTLNMADNLLDKLSERDFEGLGSLETLHLSSNPITSVDTKVFQPLTSIKTITLAGAQLTSVPDHLFENLATLKILDLSGNNITTVEQNSLTGTPLTSLNLASNLLTAIPSSAMKQTMATLNTIDLNSNQITQVGRSDFVGVDLDTLDLHNNPISTIDAGAFSGSKIKNLDLRGSKLISIPETLLTMLNRGNTALNLDGLTSWRCDCTVLWLGRYLLASTNSKSPTCGSTSNKWSGKLLTAIVPALETDCKTTTTSTTTTTTTTTSTTTSTTAATTTPATTKTTKMIVKTIKPTTKKTTAASGKTVTRFTSTIPRNDPSATVTMKANTRHSQPRRTTPGISKHSSTAKNNGNETNNSEDDTVKSILVVLIILCILAFCLTVVGIFAACVVCKRQGMVYSGSDHPDIPPAPTPMTIGWKGRMEAIQTF